MNNKLHRLYNEKIERYSELPTDGTGKSASTGSWRSPRWKSWRDTDRNGEKGIRGGEGLRQIRESVAWRAP